MIVDRPIADPRLDPTKSVRPCRLHLQRHQAQPGLSQLTVCPGQAFTGMEAVNQSGQSFNKTESEAEDGGRS
jgi:hypothetical protein